MTDPDSTQLLASPDGDMQAVIRVAQTAVTPEKLDLAAAYAFVVPDGARLELPDLERFQDSPSRKRGTYRPHTVDSFIDYVTRHFQPCTTVWVHPTSGRIVAIIDDHGGSVDAALWRDHQVVLQLQPTPEWAYWVGLDGQMVTQEAFAEHIEGGLEEIVEPAAANMLEIAQSFHATTAAQFRSSTRLASGEQRLQYDEEIKATAGATGDLNVPTQITLAVAPFVGEDPYRVTARLRFRVQSGRLSLGYRLDRPDSIVRDALDKIAGRLSELFTTYIGEPPA